MYIKTTRVRRGKKVYQYAQLVEAYRRKDGMASQRVIASLGARTDLEIANLTRALDASRSGNAVVVMESPAATTNCEVLDNLAWLDVAAVVAVLRQLGVDRILEDVLPREQADVPDTDVVLALVAQRCVEPGSKLAATEWFGRTGLPELLGLPLGRFNNTRIHRVLAGLESCEPLLQSRVASAVEASNGSFSLLFLDVTDTWFVGRGPSLATMGKTKEGLVRRKVGIALLCDQDGFPLRWSVLEGRRHDSVPMKELAWSLQPLDWARGVPLVLDRAMGATAHIVELLATGRPFVTALTRNEFDAYTDRIPWKQLADLSWNAEDAMARAAAITVQAGMTKVADELCVLDLGVVTRQEPPAPAPLPPVDGADKVRDRLRAAIAMQAALDRGEAGSLTEAGQPHGFKADLACRTLRLLRLAGDIQHRVEAGEAANLSIKDLLDLTRIDDFEVQREAFQAALDAARTTPDGRRSRKAGHVSAAPPQAPAPPEPVQLRAVLAFNPAQWARQQERADKLVAALELWVRHKNDALRDPRTRSSASKVRQAAMARLAKDHVVEAFDVTVTSESIDGQTIHRVSLELDAEAWQRRRRFYGFHIIVARPDETRPAADLVTLYRAKDKVEKDFQTIKSVLHLRPVRHRTDAKVRAHVTLCMLALLAERAIERALEGRATAASALDTLAAIRLNRLKTGADTAPVYTVTRPKAEHLDLLTPLRLESLVDDSHIAATLYAR